MGEEGSCFVYCGPHGLGPLDTIHNTKTPPLLSRQSFRRTYSSVTGSPLLESSKCVGPPCGVVSFLSDPFSSRRPPGLTPPSVSPLCHEHGSRSLYSFPLPLRRGSRTPATRPSCSRPPGVSHTTLS